MHRRRRRRRSEYSKRCMRHGRSHRAAHTGALYSMKRVCVNQREITIKRLMRGGRSGQRRAGAAATLSLIAKVLDAAKYILLAAHSFTRTAPPHTRARRLENMRLYSTASQDGKCSIKPYIALGHSIIARLAICARSICLQRESAARCVAGQEERCERERRNASDFRALGPLAAECTASDAGVLQIASTYTRTAAAAAAHATNTEMAGCAVLALKSAANGGPLTTCICLRQCTIQSYSFTKTQTAESKW